jgi:hypothetical protein
MQPDARVRQALAEQEFVVGEVYTSSRPTGRSMRVAPPLFRAVYDAWLNLLRARNRTLPHRRPPPQVRADPRRLSRRAVHRLRLQGRGRARGRLRQAHGRYAVVAVSEAVVRVYTAKSQSPRGRWAARSFRRAKRRRSSDPCRDDRGFAGTTAFQSIDRRWHRRLRPRAGADGRVQDRRLLRDRALLPARAGQALARGPLLR